MSWTCFSPCSCALCRVSIRLVNVHAALPQLNEEKIVILIIIGLCFMTFVNSVLLIFYVEIENYIWSTHNSFVNRYLVFAVHKCSLTTKLRTNTHTNATHAHGYKNQSSEFHPKTTTILQVPRIRFDWHKESKPNDNGIYRTMAYILATGEENVGETQPNLLSTKQTSISEE